MMLSDSENCYNQRQQHNFLHFLRRWFPIEKSNVLYFTGRFRGSDGPHKKKVAKLSSKFYFERIMYVRRAEGV